MSKGLAIGLGGLFAAGVLGLTALSSSDPKSCSIGADGQISLNFKDKTLLAGPAVKLTDDQKQCFNDNGSTPPDWVVPVVPGP